MSVLAFFLLLFSAAEAKNCKNSQPCGNSCISWSRICHTGSGTARKSSYTPPATPPAKSVRKEASYIPAEQDTPESSTQVAPADNTTAPRVGVDEVPEVDPDPAATAAVPAKTTRSSTTRDKAKVAESPSPTAAVAEASPPAPPASAPASSAATTAESTSTLCLGVGGGTVALLLVALFSMRSQSKKAAHRAARHAEETTRWEQEQAARQEKEREAQEAVRRRQVEELSRRKQEAAVRQETEREEHAHQLRLQAERDVIEAPNRAFLWLLKYVALADRRLADGEFLLILATIRRLFPATREQAISTWINSVKPEITELPGMLRIIAAQPIERQREILAALEGMALADGKATKAEKERLLVIKIELGLA